MAEYHDSCIFVGIVGGAWVTCCLLGVEAQLWYSGKLRSLSLALKYTVQDFS